MTQLHDDLLEELERPARRMVKAADAIRRLRHDLVDWQERFAYVSGRVDELEAENKRLRALQGPTALDQRDARIVQLDTEVKRLNKLLNDFHAEHYGREPRTLDNGAS